MGIFIPETDKPIRPWSIKDDMLVRELVRRVHNGELNRAQFIEEMRKADLLRFAAGMHVK